MYKDDYIMRLIKEMVRTLLKLICNIDMEDPTSKLVQEEDMKEELDNLLHMINDGKVCDAENRLYELLEEQDRRAMNVGLVFYSYLNEKSDDYLKKHDFSREEIVVGIKDIVNKFNLHGIADIFLDEISI